MGGAINARRGARQMYRDRWFIRKCVWRQRPRNWKGRRNTILVRITYHLIYLRLMGMKAWWNDGRR